MHNFFSCLSIEIWPIKATITSYDGFNGFVFFWWFNFACHCFGYSWIHHGFGIANGYSRKWYLTYIFNTDYKPSKWFWLWWFSNQKLKLTWGDGWRFFPAYNCLVSKEYRYEKLCGPEKEPTRGKLNHFERLFGSYWITDNIALPFIGIIEDLLAYDNH